MSDKIIVTAALTGAWPGKKDNPAVPLTPKEIADDAYECRQAGASVVHLHMRDDAGNGTMDVEKFRETVACIKEKKCDLILNLTTSGDLHATEETRMLHIGELKPEMASYDCGTMNWGHTGVFYNTPPFLEKLGAYMQEHGVKPEVEIFDGGMLYNAVYYLHKGVLKAPVHCQFVLGAPGGLDGSVENLMFLHSRLPAGWTWSALGIGKAHLPIMYATLALGGHVRVGMEDNVMYARNRPAKSNAEFVERACRLIREMNKTPASPKEAREILGLPAVCA
jgi:uncharacterized protein (DUF849 family)